MPIVGATYQYILPRKAGDLCGPGGLRPSGQFSGQSASIPFRYTIIILKRYQSTLTFFSKWYRDNQS